ncbi:MAG: hypothetical protein ACXVCY_00190 [Pseudobdellovibrionaceae bacterium]
MLQRFFLIVFGLYALSGCAHSQENRDLDQEIKELESQTDPLQLNTKIIAEIAQMPGLTESQKNQLTALKNVLRNEMHDYQKNYKILCSLLAKELTEPPANLNYKKIELIKDRLRKNETKRLSSLFNAVERANGIIGRPSIYHTRFMESFFDHNFD